MIFNCTVFQNIDKKNHFLQMNILNVQSFSHRKQTKNTENAILTQMITES